MSTNHWRPGDGSLYRMIHKLPDGTIIHVRTVMENQDPEFSYDTPLAVRRYPDGNEIMLHTLVWDIRMSWTSIQMDPNVVTVFWVEPDWYEIRPLPPVLVDKDGDYWIINRNGESYSMSSGVDPIDPRTLEERYGPCQVLDNPLITTPSTGISEAEIKQWIEADEQTPESSTVDEPPLFQSIDDDGVEEWYKKLQKLERSLGHDIFRWGPWDKLSDYRKIKYRNIYSRLSQDINWETEEDRLSDLFHLFGTVDKDWDNIHPNAKVAWINMVKAFDEMKNA